TPLHKTGGTGGEVALRSTAPALGRDSERVDHRVRVIGEARRGNDGAGRGGRGFGQCGNRYRLFGCHPGDSLSTAAPTIAERAEPTRTPKRMTASTSDSPKASVPMKRLIVKPIPVRMLVPQSVTQSAFAGISAQPARMTSAALPKTPICFPKNRPAAIASGTGSRIEENDKPAKDNPALANPNTGRIPN